jgi:cobaltochelatase CobS
MPTVEELTVLRDKAVTEELKNLYQTAIDRETYKSGQSTQQTVANALVELSKALVAAQAMQSKGVEASEIEASFKQMMANAKIGMRNLDQDVTKLLGNNIVKTQLSLNIGGRTIKSDVSLDPEFLSRPLTQLLLSDVAAHNNAYLYGGAGTGKTFMAQEIAKALGYAMIEVNCNQFTSPLDLVGGQTISGYQEGALSKAWKNEVDNQMVVGVVLNLDELPKIDPNTAGILNSALAKVKLSGSRAQITNGRGERLDKGNIFIIASGNTKLNETSEDYEANFKQDLSLQDRFVGSTYEIFIYYQTEVTQIMKGFIFIWMYMVRVREWIEKNKQTSRAFVSMRIMESMRDTYLVYRTYNEQLMSGGRSIITNPKSLEQSCESFFSLFPVNIADKMKEDTDYNGFKRIIQSKNEMPVSVGASFADISFDTESEFAAAVRMASDHDAEKSKLYNA